MKMELLEEEGLNIEFTVQEVGMMSFIQES